MGDVFRSNPDRQKKLWYSYYSHGRDAYGKTIYYVDEYYEQPELEWSEFILNYLNDNYGITREKLESYLPYTTFLNNTEDFIKGRLCDKASQNHPVEYGIAYHKWSCATWYYRRTEDELYRMCIKQFEAEGYIWDGVLTRSNLMCYGIGESLYKVPIEGVNVNDKSIPIEERYKILDREDFCKWEEEQKIKFDERIHGKRISEKEQWIYLILGFIISIGEFWAIFNVNILLMIILGIPLFMCMVKMDGRKK